MTCQNKTPGWAENAVWYQILPERFCNGNPENNPVYNILETSNIKNWEISAWTDDWYKMADWEKNLGDFHSSVWHRRYGGDLKGIYDKLDYLQNLGVNAVYLNPVFQARSLHKYDASCYHHIDPYFGPDPAGDLLLTAAANETEDPETWIWTSADKLFLKLVKEIHKRNMRIIIDGVFNHTGRDFFAFKDLLKNKQKSRYVDWYKINRWDNSLPNGFEVAGWAGHSGLPEFARRDDNLPEPVKNYIFNCTRRWMKPEINNQIVDGVDGWRLDVAHCLPHKFWKDWCSYVKSISSDAYLVGEIVTISPEYLQGDEFDALMNYPFVYCVSEFFVDNKNRVTASEFDKRLKELRDAYPIDVTMVMQNLIDSHDANRIASAILNPDREYRDWGNYHSSSKIGNNKNYDLRKPNEHEKQVLKLIVLFQMTYIGAPMIYYGDEAGMWGANDPCNRKPMLWPDMNFKNESSHPFNKPRQPDENKFDNSLFEYYRKLIHIRRESPALSRGSYKTIWLDDERNLFAFTRQNGDDLAVVVINNSNDAQHIQWSKEWPGGNFSGALAGISITNNSFLLPPVSGEIFFRQ